MALIDCITRVEDICPESPAVQKVMGWTDEETCPTISIPAAPQEIDPEETSMEVPCKKL
jgi:hypothetical protein